MAVLYISGEDVRTRIGVANYRRIFDENRDGNPDSTPADALARDSSARVRAALRASKVRYNMEAIDASPPAEVKRIALDVAELYACLRYQEVMRKDPQFIERLVKEELKALVDGTSLLDDYVEPEVGTDGDTIEAGTVILDSDMLRGW